MSEERPNDDDLSVESNQKHKAVPVRYGDQEAQVDEQIAPLILAMWRAGIRTYQSCQSKPEGWVWLQFDCSHEVERWLSIVGDDAEPGDSLHERLWCGYDGEGGFNQWEFRLVVFDPESEEIVDEDGGIETIQLGPPDFLVLTCIHFPQSDLPTVMARLNAYNARHGFERVPDGRE